MELRQGDHQRDGTLQERVANQKATIEEGRNKLLWLKRRSLLVLNGEARYDWSHGIAPRRLDRVGGDLRRRTTRISFTFRYVQGPGAKCQCGCESRVPSAHDSIPCASSNARSQQELSNLDKSLTYSLTSLTGEDTQGEDKEES
uniref:Alpha-ketoglutarate-dependent dioxygenase AlkB-like domain-containing protein n=1 Tax=Octactis speculum TaxID=3111310 RepID=A0A6U3ZEE3_9STRA